MLETVTFHHAQALAQRPAHPTHPAAARRKPSALRAFRAQWRRLRRLVVKPGRPFGPSPVA